MTDIQINEFIEKNSKYFSEDFLNSLLPRLQEYPQEMYPILMDTENLKSPTVALILAFFGFDRFYLKDYVMGFLKIIFSVLMIWMIADLFTVKRRTYVLNEKILLDSIGNSTFDYGENYVNI